MSAPMPRPAPVMNHTFLSLMSVHVFLVDVPHAASFTVALPTEPAAPGRWQTLMRGALRATPSPAGPLVEWEAWHAAATPATSSATAAITSGRSLAPTGPASP